MAIPIQRPARVAETISLAQLLDGLADPRLVIVDVRQLAAYNGWRVREETRGGHIPGAAAFPAGWLARLDEAELERLLASKGIVRNRPIVVYGHDADDSAAFAGRLRELSFESVRPLEYGWSSWASDESLPVERLPNYEQLVHAEWLRRLLGGERVEAAPRDRYLVFHVNFGVPDEYAEGHIPGSHYLDTNRLEDPADWNRRSPAALDEALRALGITNDTTVILYGRDTEGDANEKWPGRRAGQIAATRAALILRYAGVNDVRLLDGGYDWWVRTGGELEVADRQPTAVDSFGLDVPARPELIVDIAEAKQMLADQSGAALVSVRTWREHVGSVSGYNYIGPAGRIAGDVWGNCGSDAYHMQHYRTVDNTMRPYPEIAANWQAAGITPDKWVSFYCGTGWRASETWFYAWLMDWPRICVYDGGWFEWSKDPLNNPIETGLPADEAAA
jgi:3-mercaptopyruvate sulfurtransferase SseA